MQRNHCAGLRIFGLRIFGLGAIALALALSPTVRAQDDGFGPPAPPIRKATSGARLVIPVTEFDWGQVLHGDVVEHVYPIRNEGDEVLRITQVKPG